MELLLTDSCEKNKIFNFEMNFNLYLDISEDGHSYMQITRNNHYVPEWYQKGFCDSKSQKLIYLDLEPGKIELSDGRAFFKKDKKYLHPPSCFCVYDLYTTFFGGSIKDDIEKMLFGEIDRVGAKAVRAFIDLDTYQWHLNFKNFYEYMDAQKFRTPKGLDWIKSKYARLEQEQLMVEMKSLHGLNIAVWTESVREIVSAKNSNVKFILTDHPVRIYNNAFTPGEKLQYPNEPSILLKGSQTIFPLNDDNCLILTNLEYANDPSIEPTERRINPQLLRETLVSTDNLIRIRNLNDFEVSIFNYILKSGAKKFIASKNESWLYPERVVSSSWMTFKETLLPPRHELYKFNSEIVFAMFKDGTTYRQDSYGRNNPVNNFFKKKVIDNELKNNDPCGCGSGKKYKYCCKFISKDKRRTWKEISIRERNLILYEGIAQILSLTPDVSWQDLKEKLSDKRIFEIYQLYDFLWPISTDIYSLLPKPDCTSRALYSGLLDPRSTLLSSINGLIPYFDEILIHHPFIHPAIIKQEINPLIHPSLYRQQILKDLMIFLHFQMQVKEGVINFVPELIPFNLKLAKEMFQMAHENSIEGILSEQEIEKMKFIIEEDYRVALPRHLIEQEVKRRYPHASERQCKEITEYNHQENIKHPYAPLEDPAGSRLFTSYSMLPNLEMTLFLAQVTGSVIVTDSDSRWRQIENLQRHNSDISLNPWDKVNNLINKLEFVSNIYPEVANTYRENKKFIKIRNDIREILCVIYKNNDPIDEYFVNFMIKRFSDNYKKISKIVNAKENYKTKMKLLIPKGGIVNNNVQRLLIKSGAEDYLSCVFISILIECESLNKEKV